MTYIPVSQRKTEKEVKYIPIAQRQATATVPAAPAKANPFVGGINISMPSTKATAPVVAQHLTKTTTLPVETSSQNLFKNISSGAKKTSEKVVESTVSLGKAIAQAPQRAITSVTIQPIADTLSLIKNKQIEAKYTPKTKIEKMIFGEEPIVGIFKSTTDAKNKTKEIMRKIGVEKNIAEGMSLAIAPLFVGGTKAFDLTPIGGAEKKISSEIIEGVIKNIDNVEDAFSILKKMGVADDIAEKFSKEVVEATTDDATKSVIIKLAEEQRKAGGTIAKEVKKYIPVARREAKAAEEVAQKEIGGYVPVAKREAKVADEIIPTVTKKETPVLKMTADEFAAIKDKEKALQEMQGKVFHLTDSTEYIKIPKDMTDDQIAKLYEEAKNVEKGREVVHISDIKVAREAKEISVEEAIKKSPDFAKTLDNIGYKATEILKEAEVPMASKMPELKNVIAKSTPEEIKKEVAKFVRENLPRSEAGSFITKVAQVKTPHQANKIIDLVGDRIEKLDQLKVLGKELSTEKSKISFILKNAELNQTVVNEVKREVGLSKPLSKATEKQLNDIVGKLKERLEFKTERGFKPTITGVEKQAPKFSQSFYDEVVAVKRTKGQEIIKDFKESGKQLAKGADKLLGSISTRLKNIDPSLKRALRKFEYDRIKAIQSDRKILLPYFEKTKNINIRDISMLDIALKNGDIIKREEILSKYGAKKEYEKVQEVLKNLYKRAEEVGFKMGEQKNYFPRVVNNAGGFLEYLGKGDDWSIINKAIQNKEMKLGRYLTIEEKASLINTMERGYSSDKITLSHTGAMKARQIDFIDPELNQFYADSNTALLQYVNQMNEAIEARRFFGKELSKVDDMSQLKVDDSIGAYTAKLLAEGKLKPSQEKELKNILAARFGEKGTSGVVNVIKNLAYIDTMGTPMSAITQIGDLAFSIYKNGLPETVKSFSKAIFGKTKLRKEDIGIEKIAEEFAEKSKTANAVTKVFRLVGLEKMDSVGKSTFIDSTLSRMFSRAKREDSQLVKELKEVFGDNYIGVLDDLKNKKISEDVKYLTFNKLLDFQPVALSEMPEQYLKGGNGRIFYALKTYTLKMFDVYRNEGFQLLKNPETRVEGIKNIVKLSAALVIMNATADEIKDFMLGKETSLKDRTIDNIAKLFGLNKFTLDSAASDGIGSAILGSIKPPTKFLDNAYKDITKSEDINGIEDLRSIRSLPAVGELYYWWFGKGTKSQNKKPQIQKGSIKIKAPKLKVNTNKINTNIPKLKVNMNKINKK